MKLKLDGDTFNDTARIPSSATINSGFASDVTKRILEGSATEIHRLEFEANAARSGYTITVTFDDGESEAYGW